MPEDIQLAKKMVLGLVVDTFIRPTKLEIDLDAIAHNYRAVLSHVAPAQVMPVLKANAYGHGLLECAQVFESAGAKILAVAFLEEAIALRQAGIKTRILTLGGFSGRQLQLFIENDLDCTASSVSKIEQIDQIARNLGATARVHLKIDTGMERVGVHDYSVAPFFDAAKNSKNIQIVGIYSHCPRAEEIDTTYTRSQFERFEVVIKLADEYRLLTPEVQRHFANSGAICSLAETHLDIVRPGLLLYGYAPIPEWTSVIDLRPALKLSSEVVYFKVVRKGAGVSYNHSWHAKEQTRIATVPIGYGDGYMRAFSNKASVLIRQERYPIVGNVCMDQFMVNLGDGTAYNGDEVVLLGAQGNQRIDLHELADWAQTDPREILCALNARIPREFVGG